MSARRPSSSATTGGFLADLRETYRDYSKHTSAGHKRFVLLLVVVGALLRAALLARPISQEEAFAYVEFATLPFGRLIADYTYPSNHILHTLLTRWSTGLFGVGLVPLRLPAFLAGVLVMPLLYLFVRAMFNRYIALLTLALVAGSGPLIEYSAMARGFSITWLCLLLALVFGRHLVKTNSAASAVLIGLCCALGMWSVPSMVYGVILVYVWLLLSLALAYESSLRPRYNLLALSVLVFAALTVLLYLPVIGARGIDPLTHHPSIPYLSWKEFRSAHEEMAFAFWAYVVDSSSAWLAILGLGGLVHAAFVSSKFRTLAFAMLVGAVPLVLVQRQVIQPQHWLYTLFLFHLSSAIALFYLLKFVAEKLAKGLGKRTRTMAAATVLLIVFGWPGMQRAWKRTRGMPEAARAVAYARNSLKPGDRFFVQYPWDAPITFHAIAAGMDPGIFTAPAADGASILVGVSPDHEQTPESVLRHHAQDPARWPPPRMVQDWPGLKIFAAP